MSDNKFWILVVLIVTIGINAFFGVVFQTYTMNTEKRLATAEKLVQNGSDPLQVLMMIKDLNGR